MENGTGNSGDNVDAVGRRRATDWDVAREYFVYALNIAQRRWKLLLVPVAVAVLLASIAVEMAPTTYTARSLILLKSANRGGPGAMGDVARQNAADQISAVEAWLKSDEVLLQLLPQLTDARDLRTTSDVVGQLRRYRQSLTLELVGGSAVEVRLVSGRAAGLARKLEAIVARLMEGLTGPDQSIFSARQFILLRRKEELAASGQALAQRIHALGNGSDAAILDKLERIAQLSNPAEGADPAQPAAELATLRAQVSRDPAVQAELEALYAQHETMRRSYETYQSGLPPAPTNYFGLFEAPDSLLIVGRPQDPIYGESSAKKIAVAGILFSVLAALAAALLAEVLDGRLRTEQQFVRASGLPMVSRLGCDPAAATPEGGARGRLMTAALWIKHQFG